MIRNAAATTALVLAGVLASAPMASAAPPVRSDRVVFNVDETFDDPFLTEVCGFPVTARLSGHYWETTFYNQDGSVNRVTAHPSFRSTLTSPTTSITTSDVGLDRYVENADGTWTIFGTGIHLKIGGGTKAIGLWRLVTDQNGELISEEYHGRFDATAPEIVDALCDALS